MKALRYLQFGELTQFFCSWENLCTLGEKKEGIELLLFFHFIPNQISLLYLQANVRPITLNTAELTKVSLPCGRTIVFSRLLITILHSSFSTRFNTVFSHTVANSVSLQKHANTHKYRDTQVDETHGPQKVLTQLVVVLLKISNLWFSPNYFCKITFIFRFRTQMTQWMSWQLVREDVKTWRYQKVQENSSLK